MYSREEIQEKRRDGELTKLQADKMLLALASKPKPKPEPKKAPDVLALLSIELKRLAESVDASIKNQTKSAIDINTILPVMQKTYEALQKKPKIEIVTPKSKNPKKWNVEFGRDDKGLIKSPIRLVAEEV